MSPTAVRTAALQLVRDVTTLEQTPGIYAMWCQEASRLSLLSIRPTANLKTSISRFHQLQNWRVHCGNKIIFSLCYMPGSTPQEREEAAAGFKNAIVNNQL